MAFPLGPPTVVGGDIAIARICRAEEVNIVRPGRSAAVKVGRDRYPFEMKLELLASVAEEEEEEEEKEKEAPVQLCLCAATEAQRKTWISGIFYLRSLCPREYFQ